MLNKNIFPNDACLHSLSVMCCSKKQSFVYMNFLGICELISRKSPKNPIEIELLINFQLWNSLWKCALCLFIFIYINLFILTKTIDIKRCQHLLSTIKHVKAQLDWKSRRIEIIGHTIVTAITWINRLWKLFWKIDQFIDRSLIKYRWP